MPKPKPGIYNVCMDRVGYCHNLDAFFNTTALNMKNLFQQKIGRNDPCPCQSGKKYKNCCEAVQQSPKNQEDCTGLIQTARQYAYQQGNFDGAEQCYRQVLAANPNHIEALAGVGQGLCWRHRRAEGRQYLAKAAKLMLRHAHKTDARELLELSGQLQLWGEIALALQLARAAAKNRLGSAAAHFAMASCLQRMNQTDQAIVEIRKALQMAPNDSGCQILMAILELDKKQYGQAQQRLEEVLAKETDPLQSARACLELAKIYDKQKRYPDAFTLIAKAEELHKQLPGIGRVDAEYIFKKIALYKQGYDPCLMQRWTAADFADGLPAPVFLVGFLRSGTTLTEQVLAAHPQVMTSDENFLLDETVLELEQLAGIKGNTPEALRNLDIAQAKQLRQFYWQRASEEFGPQVLTKCFVNKVALNSIEVGLISVLFPEAKIIFALRDPRDVCLSCATQAFTLSVSTVNMLSWQGIAKQYAAVMDLWLSLRDNIAPKFLELRYEDTVTDFESSFRRVFNLLELDWYADVVLFHQKTAGKFIVTPSFAAVSQPLYQTAVARWQGYEAYFEPIQALLQPYIDAFAYSGSH